MKKLAAFTAVALVLLPAQAASADLVDLVPTGDLTAGVFPQDQFSTLSSSGDPFAVGGGTASTTKFAFSAHCKNASVVCPSGTASGYAVVKDPVFGDVQGNVICYRAFGTGRAVFEIEEKKGSGFLGSGLFVTFAVTDSGVTPPTGDQLFAAPHGIPLGCAALGIVGGFVTQGNIVVKN